MRVSFWFIIVSVILLSIPFVATQYKGLLISAYNKYRVVFLDGRGEKCLRELEQTETVFRPLGNQGTDTCPVKNAVRISKHWKEKGSKGDTLREAARVACKYFSNVLTPETNRLHHNHFYLDSGIGFQCKLR